jgi:mRNA-degrading endonuclease YafQ of YafQ-DinJ toxin-antitoxin module
VEVSFSPSFKRAFKRRIKGDTEAEARFWQKFDQFKANPFDPSLKTHKLSGKFKEYWSFSVEYDQRVLFYFNKDENAVFIDIGSHDEVY